MHLRIFAWLLLATGLYGQTSAELSGRVVDSTGAVVPNAAVTVVNIDRGASRSTESSDQGYFSSQASTRAVTASPLRRLALNRPHAEDSNWTSTSPCVSMSRSRSAKFPRR